MIAFPNAKINIGLNIIEKRNDGFHNLESVFFPSKLTDVLEITKQTKGKTQFKNTGLIIDSPSDTNSCIRAYNLLRNDFDISAVKIHLHKLIPFGGGLGGGSADASFTLIILNKLFKLNISNDKLLQYAEKLGSDCPFFIHNSVCYASGKGEILEEIKLDLKGLYLSIINPGFQIGTKEAYASINPQKHKIDLKEIIQNPIKDWKNFIKNDFEKNAFELYPKLEDIKKSLYKNGALYASMSGSGSSIYGFFDTKPDLSEYNNCFIHTEQI